MKRKVITQYDSEIKEESKKAKEIYETNAVSYGI